MPVIDAAADAFIFACQFFFIAAIDTPLADFVFFFFAAIDFGRRRHYYALFAAMPAAAIIRCRFRR
jgi:hypothetical protein